MIPSGAKSTNNKEKTPGGPLQQPLLVFINGELFDMYYAITIKVNK